MFLLSSENGKSGSSFVKGDYEKKLLPILLGRKKAEKK